MNHHVVGMIAGNGMAPAEIAKICIDNNIKLCVAAIEGQAELKLIDHVPHKLFPIGDVGAVIKYFQEFGVNKIVFIGGVKRVELRSIRADLVGMKLMAKILSNKFLGDDKLLRVIADFFENQGFEVISAAQLMQLNIITQPIIAKTKIQPNAQDLADIQLGMKVLDAMGSLDIGQAVIVEDGYILGVEAAEGTDALIERCAALRKKKSGGVLVKTAKLAQDLRLDLPTIGPQTLRHLANFKYRGLAIPPQHILIIESKTVMELANELNLFIRAYT